MSNADWEPEHRTILALDIEGFGSATRTDPIRAGLRRSLASLTADALRSLNDRLEYSIGDTGDGKWIIFPNEISKPSVLTTFIPALEVQLRHYNTASSEVAKIRLRIGVHHGDIIWDGNGYVGEALNHVFRIIDNEIARESLRSSPGDSVTIISDDLYHNIVKQGYGALDPRNFAPVRIHVKETVTTIWIKSSQATGAKTSTTTLSKTSPTQQILTLSDLSPSALYIPLAEVHNAALR